MPFVPTRLFPNPYCCLCFKDLHKGHKGWDVCADCHQHELRYVEVYRADLDDYDCSCYKEGSMKNVDLKVDGNILTITVDLSKDFGKSASGKTNIVATTEGAVALADGTQVGVNIYRK